MQGYEVRSRVAGEQAPPFGCTADIRGGARIWSVEWVFTEVNVQPPALCVELSIDDIPLARSLPTYGSIPGTWRFDFVPPVPIARSTKIGVRVLADHGGEWRYARYNSAVPSIQVQ